MSDRIVAEGFRLLAPGTRKGNRYWMARGEIDGALREFSTRCLDLNAAIAALPTLVDIYRRQTTRFSRVQPDGWHRRLYLQALDRARTKALPFSLTMEDVAAMVTRAGGNCEVSGHPFTDERPTDAKRRPFAPSIDRRNPAIGYTPENCRLVCFAVNVAMSDWGEDVFMRLARAALSGNRRGRM